MNIDKTLLDNSNKFCQRYHVPVKSRVTTAKAISKTRKSSDKDEAKKTETETTNNIQKLKENTQKTKSKRETRTPPKTGSMDQMHRYSFLAENTQEFIFVQIPKKKYRR